MRGVSIYRPNNDPTKGCAFQFKPGTSKRGKWVVFVEATNQTGPKPPPGSTDSPFDWSKKILMMLSVDEVSELAASIRGISRKPIKFTHQLQDDSGTKLSYLTIAPSENKEYDNWSVSFSVKRADILTKVNGFVSPGQIYQILCLIDSVIYRSFDFEKIQRQAEAEEAVVDQNVAG
jgi:hypothetical protein